MGVRVMNLRGDRVSSMARVVVNPAASAQEALDLEAEPLELEPE